MCFWFLAIEWLQMHSNGTDWPRLIKYLETVARQTYENQPVSLNLIVRKGPGLAISPPRDCSGSSTSLPRPPSLTWPWTAIFA